MCPPLISDITHSLFPHDQPKSMQHCATAPVIAWRHLACRQAIHQNPEKTPGCCTHNMLKTSRTQFSLQIEYHTIILSWFIHPTSYDIISPKLHILCTTIIQILILPIPKTPTPSMVIHKEYSQSTIRNPNSNSFILLTHSIIHKITIRSLHDPCAPSKSKETREQRCAAGQICFAARRFMAESRTRHTSDVPPGGKGWAAKRFLGKI